MCFSGSLEAVQTSLSFRMALKGACMYACTYARKDSHKHKLESACAHMQENEIPVIEQHMHILTQDQGHQNIPRLCLKKTNVLCS